MKPNYPSTEFGMVSSSETSEFRLGAPSLQRAPICGDGRRDDGWSYGHLVLASDPTVAA